MPTLIHLADEKDAGSILRSGIKIGKYRQGVFFMPLVADFFISHQWLRELKRRGVKSYVGVYFKLSDEEEVWYGRYNERHRRARLGEAIGLFMHDANKLGYEFLLERKIEPKEIFKLVKLPQVVGWRYSPDSHHKEMLCACPLCISSGEINSRKKREKIKPPVVVLSYTEIVEQLKVEQDEQEIDNLLRHLRRKRRKADPMTLAFLMERNNIFILKSFILALPAFKHPNAFKMLADLCIHLDESVRRSSVEGLLRLDHIRALAYLASLPADELINQVIQVYLQD